MKKKIGIIILIALVAIQFFPAEKNQGTSFGEENIKEAYVPEAPDSVLAILQMACFDCHSDHTIYPWYTNIQPVGWWMAKHVKNGKKRLNFDEWKDYPQDKQEKKLKAIIKDIEEEEMPLKSYTLIHRDANLTEAQKKTVIDWIKSPKQIAPPEPWEEEEEHEAE